MIIFTSTKKINTYLILENHILEMKNFIKINGLNENSIREYVTKYCNDNPNIVFDWIEFEKYVKQDLRDKKIDKILE